MRLVTCLCATWLSDSLSVFTASVANQTLPVIDHPTGAKRLDYSLLVVCRKNGVLLCCMRTPLLTKLLFAQEEQGQPLLDLD